MTDDIRLVLAGVVAGFILLWSAQHASAAAPASLSAAGGPEFPERAFVLTLPSARSLLPQDVTVTENGEAVESLEVVPGDSTGPRTFGVVLAIDASQSMRGAAIGDAMQAARAFAAGRAPRQSMGVVFFNSRVRTALAPTTDGRRIAAALAAAPPLDGGTHLYDGTVAAANLLRRARISAGSVVVLSDGADAGSDAGPAAVAAALRRAEGRAYAVGLRSPSFDADSLRTLAADSRGRYAEAASSDDLRPILASLGAQLGNQHLLRYRSMAALGSQVRVAARVRGLDEVAEATYRAPQATAAARRPSPQPSPWTSPWATAAVVALLAALVGWATFWWLRPQRATVRSRVADFVIAAEMDAAENRPGRARGRGPILAEAERSLERSRLWAAFKQEVELARMEIEALYLALGTAAGTVALGWLFAKAGGRPGLALFALVIPLVVRLLIHAKVDRLRRAFADQLPDNLQVLASAMRAGHSFVGALSAMVDDAPEPSRSEFRRVLADEQLGVRVNEALGRVANRMRNRDLEYVGLVAALQVETGGNTAEVLDRVTETIRERGELRRLVSSLTAQGRLGGWIVSALPLALMGILSVINPGYLDPLLERQAGVLMLVGAGCSLVTGLLVIRRIVAIKV